MDAPRQIPNTEILSRVPPVSIPVVSRSRFAELIGVDEGVVLGWVNKGYLPTFKMGKYSLINIEALRQSCSDRGLL